MRWNVIPKVLDIDPKRSPARPLARRIAQAISLVQHQGASILAQSDSAGDPLSQSRAHAPVGGSPARFGITLSRQFCGAPAAFGCNGFPSLRHASAKDTGPRFPSSGEHATIRGIPSRLRSASVCAAPGLPFPVSCLDNCLAR